MLFGKCETTICVLSSDFHLGDPVCYSWLLAVGCLVSICHTSEYSHLVKKTFLLRENMPNLILMAHFKSKKMLNILSPFSTFLSFSGFMKTHYLIEIN